MKRYDIVNFAHVEDAYMDESPTGEWVPAEVAQALYDALYGLLGGCTSVRGIDMEFYIKTEIDRAEKAISIADGDEQ
jgi:hypothetical protein